MIDTRETIVWGEKDNEPLLARRCPECGGMARLVDGAGTVQGDCPHCGGLGWLGIDPHLPVKARPGSIEKIAMLGVRYASGVPLWNDDDGPEPELPEHLRRPAFDGSRRVSDDGIEVSLADFDDEFLDDEVTPKSLAP